MAKNNIEIPGIAKGTKINVQTLQLRMKKDKQMIKIGQSKIKDLKRIEKGLLRRLAFNNKLIKKVSKRV